MTSHICQGRLNPRVPMSASGRPSLVDDVDHAADFTGNFQSTSTCLPHVRCILDEIQACIHIQILSTCNLMWRGGNSGSSTSLCPMDVAMMAMLRRDLRNHQRTERQQNYILEYGYERNLRFCRRLNTLGLDHGCDICFRCLHFLLHDVVSTGNAHLNLQEMDVIRESEPKIMREWTPK
jgi:hypothetical protein